MVFYWFFQILYKSLQKYHWNIFFQKLQTLCKNDLTRRIYTSIFIQRMELDALICSFLDSSSRLTRVDSFKWHFLILFNLEFTIYIFILLLASTFFDKILCFFSKEVKFRVNISIGLVLLCKIINIKFNIWALVEFWS